MIPTLEEQAIKAALDQNWKKAIELNKNILKNAPKNTAALNRLGRAYWEIGKISLAIKAYKKVLKLDRLNPIAQKSLQRLSTEVKDRSNKKQPDKKPNLVTSGKIFLEEPGKTKLVKLVRLATPSVLARLNSADPLSLIIRKRNVSVFSEDGSYLGVIPENLSQRLIRFMKGGNQYQAFVKSVDRQYLEIFIREVVRGKKFSNTPSFL